MTKVLSDDNDRGLGDSLFSQFQTFFLVYTEQFTLYLLWCSLTLQYLSKCSCNIIVGFEIKAQLIILIGGCLGGNMDDLAFSMLAQAAMTQALSIYYDLNG